jgi:hypothetical protein
LARLGEPTAELVPPTTVLGDWYANLLNVGRLRLVLCSSERTLLTVLIPARDPAALPDRLRAAVARTLGYLAIPADAIAREDREMRWHQIGRTASRQVLGSMNDFAFLADTYVRDDGPDADLDAIAILLNRAPCRPIQYESPDRATQAAFRRAS